MYGSLKACPGIVRQWKLPGKASWVVVVSVWTLLTGVACAAGPEIGQPAPDFALPDEKGTIHRLSGYRGRTVVLMFYPKDFTPG